MASCLTWGSGISSAVVAGGVGSMSVWPRLTASQPPSCVFSLRGLEHVGTLNTRWVDVRRSACAYARPRQRRKAPGERGVDGERGERGVCISVLRREGALEWAVGHTSGGGIWVVRAVGGGLGGSMSTDGMSSRSGMMVLSLADEGGGSQSMYSS